MQRGLYITATSMMTQTRKMDVITNNVVNAETAGYRKDDVISSSFRDQYLVRLEDPNTMSVYNAPRIGLQNKGVYVDELKTTFARGSLDMTERTGDMALTEDGFFVISTPEGDRYTRAGNFIVNSQGYLTTNEGYMVQDASGGNILVGNQDFIVDDSGQISINDEVVTTLNTVSFDDNGWLRKVGNNLFMNYEDRAAIQPYEGAVKQGYLETSNVDVGREMVDMMTTYRLYETSQRMAKIIDETLQKAVNEISRL